MARPISVIAATIFALALTGCAGTQIPTAIEMPATPSTVPDDMVMRSPDVGFECGEISALTGIAVRSQWEYDNGAIDAAAFASRQAALADAWNYVLTGQTQVSSAIREAPNAVTDAASLSAPEAQAATGALTAACDEAGSLLGMGALPEMGG